MIFAVLYFLDLNIKINRRMMLKDTEIYTPLVNVNNVAVTQRIIYNFPIGNIFLSVSHAARLNHKKK